MHSKCTVCLQIVYVLHLVWMHNLEGKKSIKYKYLHGLVFNFTAVTTRCLHAFAYFQIQG